MSSSFIVTNAPFCAVGNGLTSDRAAIQSAIDEAYAAGGGVVELPAGKTFLSGDLVLRDHVTLQFGDGATLLQNPDPADYYKPVEGGYEPCPPVYGHNIPGAVKWNHAWYANLPLIYAPEGTVDVKITGKGILKMMSGPCDKVLHIAPVGFYRVHGFEIADITVTNYHTYAMMLMTCDHGLIRNVKVENYCCGNNDGFHIMNCQHLRITGCRVRSNDDALYFISSFCDPRGGTWWNSEEPQTNMDFEVDHNDLATDHCKAFGMILWGVDCPDLEKVEVRDVYVHDNKFQTMGNWLMNPYTNNPTVPPVTHFRFENNEIDAIEVNFFETQFSDINFYHCMTSVRNGEFKDGRICWVARPNAAEDSVGIVRANGDVEGYGYLDHLDRGDAALYQGVYISAGHPNLLSASIRTVGGACRLFVRDLDSGELIAEQQVNSADWQDAVLEFSVPRDGNYHVGVEGGDLGATRAEIKNVVFYGDFKGAFGYGHVRKDTGKIMFFYK